MRTLNEVITALTICKNPDINRNCKDCPMPDTNECMGVLMTDALYYLKEYRSDMQMYSENQKYWEDELKQKIKDFGDAKERYIKRLKELDIGTLNDPLTWDKLRTMEGKPVWIEYDNHLSGRKRIKYKVWDVIDWVTEDLILVKGDYSYKKDEFGDVWQVYLKERS